MPPPFLATSSSPSAPVRIGEHVLCRLSPSRAERVDAVVVELDNVYRDAVRAFEQRGVVGPPGTPPRVEGEWHALHGPGQALQATATLGAVEQEHMREGVKAPKRLTVDLTADPIDLDADENGGEGRGADGREEETVASSHILFREADACGVHSPSLSPRRKGNCEGPESPPSKRRRVAGDGKQRGVGVEANGEIESTAALPRHPITRGRVYVHFSGLDRRLDRWVEAGDLDRTPPSMIAAAASGAVENTLVHDAKQAELAVAETPGKHTRKLTRSRRRAYEETNPVSEREMGNEAIARMEQMREEATKVKNIDTVVIGDCVVDAWYYSPYPSRHGGVLTARALYVCPYCLKYMQAPVNYTRHRSTCKWKHPPGALIYEAHDDNLRLYEIDGALNVGYCQMLCLFGKLFLDHKTLYFDVAPFIFYVVTLHGDIAGFFSKEKPAIGSEFNLACILTLPQHQRKGVGRFLISLSYALTKKEGKTGSPERPLSDLGQISYRRYWIYAITKCLENKVGTAGVPAKDLAQATGIRVEDITPTLKSMQILSIWKGVSYADTNSKALEAAIKRLKEPPLPLCLSRLFDSAKTQRERAVSATAKNINGARTPSSVSRKKLKKTTPKSSPRPSAASKIDRGDLDAVSPYALKTMTKFIEVAKARSFGHPLDSPHGISSSAVGSLAQKLGLPKALCWQKLRMMAGYKVKYEKDLRSSTMDTPRSRRLKNKSAMDPEEPPREAGGDFGKESHKELEFTPPGERGRELSRDFACESPAILRGARDCITDDSYPKRNGGKLVRYQINIGADVDHDEDLGQRCTQAIDVYDGRGMQMPVTGLNGTLHYSPPGQAILFKRSSSGGMISPRQGTLLSPRRGRGRPRKQSRKNDIVDVDASSP